MSSNIIIAIIQTILLIIFFLYRKSYYSWLTDGNIDLLALIATSIVYICMEIGGIYHFCFSANLWLFLSINLGCLVFGIIPDLVKAMDKHKKECYKFLREKCDVSDDEFDAFKSKSRKEQLDFLLGLRTVETKENLIKNAKDLKWWEPILSRRKSG